MSNQYFIHYIQTYANVNRKGKEMNEYISKFKDILVMDNCALDALKAEIQTMVGELNEKYPKSKPIRFREHGSQWRVDVDENSVVFIMGYSQVRGYYSFGEDFMSIKSLESKPGICKVCGCTEDDPCFNPNVGTCWWADEDHTLCSHCADPKLKSDPETVHCINSEGGQP